MALRTHDVLGAALRHPVAAGMTVATLGVAGYGFKMYHDLRESVGIERSAGVEIGGLSAPKVFRFADADVCFGGLVGQANNVSARRASHAEVGPLSGPEKRREQIVDKVGGVVMVCSTGVSGNIRTNRETGDYFVDMGERSFHTLFIPGNPLRMKFRSNDNLLTDVGDNMFGPGLDVMRHLGLAEKIGTENGTPEEQQISELNAAATMAAYDALSSACTKAAYTTLKPGLQQAIEDFVIDQTEWASERPANRDQVHVTLPAELDADSLFSEAAQQEYAELRENGVEVSVPNMSADSCVVADKLSIVDAQKLADELTAGGQNG